MTDVKDFSPEHTIDVSINGHIIVLSKPLPRLSFLLTIHLLPDKGMRVDVSFVST